MSDLERLLMLGLTILVLINMVRIHIISKIANEGIDTMILILKILTGKRDE